MSVLCLVMRFYVYMFQNCYLFFSGFFGDKVWLFLVNTGWQPWFIAF